ncbi:SRPBCC domain-containing protein [Roseovarius atlanticus]|uniref:SRPBCC family protein n=1 Tax=Roseovarius atlanticus TaxID=1641875 RepID=UPI001C949BDF|nr:SRPBCC domain-containing protein [Roseovarius atlanticus]MBY5989053.1 SRPBCC domain-containing protein [Roseovarius atlanticus]MBY6124445.1 SRPBCC domain-containing protein [Roseovarius atlanticus]MBY6148940.1 SRPBCC domain-containing protein [Roseovarius atlanticus]
MTATETDLTLTVERVIDATPERLFDAWLDPETMKRFICPGETVVPSASSDAVEGGRFEVIMRNGDKDLPHTGTYREIDRPNRLVFTWESHASRDDSEVTITFTPGPGGTRVELTQVRFVSEEQREGHRWGWTGILEKLSQLDG